MLLKQPYYLRQYNLYQNTKGVSQRALKSPKIHIETQTIPNRENNLEKEGNLEVEESNSLTSDYAAKLQLKKKEVYTGSETESKTTHN